VSIIVGVAAMNWTDGLARGFMKQMLVNQLGVHTAHLQIHARGFNDNKVVQNYMLESNLVIALLEQMPAVKQFSPRIIAFGLLSSASSSAGVSIVGIDPDKEAGITTIHKDIIEGKYLSGDPHEIVLSKRLAKTLDVGLGDRIVTMASTIDGTVGSEMFRVVGLYQSASISFEKMYIYVPIATAQQMLHVADRIAEVAVVAENIDSVGAIQKASASKLGTKYEVLSYRDLLPFLVSQIEMMDSMIVIFYVLIGAAMIFGIINTLLMSVFERIHEFGVLKSIGMKNGYVFSMIEIEAMLLGIVGSVIGTAIGVSVVSIVEKTGLNLTVFSEGLAAFGSGAILYPVLDWGSVALEIVVILFICMLAAIYPARRAMKLEPVQAIYYV
jgi:ABC-type lipoprotein release transport system permease subunit